jgi:hypothetical protein
MQKKVLIGLFTLLSVGLVWVLLAQLNQDVGSVEVTHEYLSPTQKQSVQIQKKSTWTEELADVSNSEFQFPVNELFMQIDLKSYVPPKVKFFRLVIDRTDRYSLFCIIQTLSSLNLPFVLDNKSKTPDIFVTSKTQESLDVVVKRLKEYDIESKIVEVWL